MSRRINRCSGLFYHRRYDYRDFRADLAKRDLADNDLSITKIAWLLGYQDVSAFTNAFKRWTGKTPRVVSQELQ